MRPKLLLWIEGNFAPCSRSDFHGSYPYLWVLVLTKKSMKPWKPRVNFTDNYPVRSVFQISRLEYCFSIITVDFRSRQQMKQKKPGVLFLWIAWFASGVHSHSLMYATQVKLRSKIYVNRMGLWNDIWFIIQHWLLRKSLTQIRKWSNWQAIDSSLDLSS